jgi:hypothetical protein
MIIQRITISAILLLTINHITSANTNKVHETYSPIKQPSIPDNYTETPFIETAPSPILNADEKKCGYLLFQRPITDPVYPNTHPLPYERINKLSAFAAPGEFEPLTFSIYPVRNLVNFKVQISNLKSTHNIIDQTDIDIRLVTYWNIGYPRYTSRSTYRRVPELLEKVSAYSSPAYECQRWWITIHAPENTMPGIYTGKITLSDDSNNSQMNIPIKFRVLDFKLISDPHKHYSTYYAMKNRIQYTGKTDAEADKMLNNEYIAMKNIGLNMVPTMRLDWDSENNKISLYNAPELKKMMAMGLKGPVPVTSSGVVSHYYKETTPEGKYRSHWNITKMPPPECYEKIKQAFIAFIKESKTENWPEFYCCPIDEVSAERKEFGAKVFQAVRDAGMKTYITKNPVAADAEDYKSVVNAWCSQPFSVPYEEIVNQNRYEYWSYPNHNAGEIKDRLTMCKGGRMTYGYGFWRSGFSTLIPWHWSWVMKPDQFDYLRSRRSGCGQRIDENGNIIPAIYWECFREGIDDERYIYTLEQTIWERRNSDNLQCKKTVTEAMSVLQKLWDDINVQEKYLRTGMWESTEFNTRRWQLATLITKLLKYPATEKGIAPSVIINTTNQKRTTISTSIMEKEIKRGNIEINDLSDSFPQWQNETTEGKLSITNAAGLNGKDGLRWIINVNHKGGEKGYPIGWPRIRCYFKNSPLNFLKYDYLKYMIKIDSNRNEVDDDITPLGFTIISNKFFEETKDIGGRQRVWLPIIFNIHDLIDAVAKGETPWQTINMLQIFIAEANYKDKTKITFDIGSIQLLRFKTPVIVNLKVPTVISLPVEKLAVKYELTGNINTGDNYTIIASMINSAGDKICSTTTKINKSTTILMNLTKIKPGNYTLTLSISLDNKSLSNFSRQIEFITGPL